MQAQRGNKKARSLQSNNERFPICKMAQDVINALKLGGDKSSAFHLTNCFRGFSQEMQEEMANYLLSEMHYRITGKDKPEMTGLFHVDRLLIEILYILESGDSASYQSRPRRKPDSSTKGKLNRWEGSDYLEFVPAGSKPSNRTMLRQLGDSSF